MWVKNKKNNITGFFVSPAVNPRRPVLFFRMSFFFRIKIFSDPRVGGVFGRFKAICYLSNETRDRLHLILRYYVQL